MDAAGFEFGSEGPTGVGLTEVALTDGEWRAPSAAAGWSIADVVGHIAATAHNFFAPSLEILRTKDLEASNECPLNDAAAGPVSG